jgi:hypothetical protein
LTITVEDIYFITSLSHRGEVPNFTTHGGGGQTINDYINEYCEDGTRENRLTSAYQAYHQFESKGDIVYYSAHCGI